MAGTDDARASFGFRDVAAGEKARLVRGVFDSVAVRYDLMNDLMSAGVHRIWKSVFIDRLNPQPGEILLDVAGGTGDIAIAFLERADERPRAAQLPPARAIVCDINLEMLAAGRKRGSDPFHRDAATGAAPMNEGEGDTQPHPEAGREAMRPDGRSGAADPRLVHVCADAESLPYADSSVDAYTIAFGIRNVTRIEKALAEARRVLKIGGRFQCLEFSHLATEGLQKLYDAYSFRVIPWLGDKVAGDRESYQYLVESIRRFPAQERFAGMVRDAGFQRVAIENLSAGIVAIHSGRRI